MPIQNYKSIQIELLDIMSNKEIYTTEQIYQRMKIRMDINSINDFVMTEDGKEEKWKNEVRWGLNDLKINGEIKSEKRGHYVITDFGTTMLILIKKFPPQKSLTNFNHIRAFYKNVLDGKIDINKL